MPAPEPAIVIGTIAAPALPAVPVIGGFAMEPATGIAIIGGITGALPATPPIGVPVLIPGVTGVTGVLVAGEVL